MTVGEHTVEAPKLLVVEDDLPSLELMSTVFESFKAEVRPISDSAAAARLVDQERFDGIFLDLEMPRMNGFELAHRVRESNWNKSTPIVIVTGRDERDTMRQAFSMGATFFLQKPVDRQKLSRLFRTVRGSFAENRRRSTRVSMQTEVDCTSDSRTLRGTTWNISEGGLQVEVAGLRLSETIRLSFRLPASQVLIEAFGSVIWTKQGRQGIKFTEITDANREQIREFIALTEQP